MMSSMVIDLPLKSFTISNARLHDTHHDDGDDDDDDDDNGDDLFISARLSFSWHSSQNVRVY